MKNITIKIYEGSDEQGFFYDIFDEDGIGTDEIPEDGGFCTTTMENALEMAVEMAKSLIAKEKGKCFACGQKQDEDGRCRCTNKDGK